MNPSVSTAQDLTTTERWRHRIAFWRHRLRGQAYQMTVPMFGQPVTLIVTTSREFKRAVEVSYEGFFLERILGSLQEGDVFFDVGANIGLVSLIVAHHPRFKDGVVHGFEPEPRNLDHMRRNIGANRFEGRVHAHDVALAKEEGTAELFVRGQAGEGRHSLVSERGASGAIAVKLTTMDAFCRAEDVLPTVVKIDVEGAEGEVLAGMEGLLERHRPREMFMEIHNKGGEDRMPDGSLIADWLAARDYEQVWEKRRGHGRHRQYRDKRRIKNPA